MKIVVLISAIAEWNAIKPLFSDAKIRRFPFGECFDILIQDEHISFSIVVGVRSLRLDRCNMCSINILQI